MKVVASPNLPTASLLNAYRAASAYTDAFYLDVPGAVTLSRYIAAFYTTPLFKMERLVLATLVAKPSSDAQAHALAAGERSRFAAWTVEDRDDAQIVMCDFMRKTRSWLMVEPLPQGGTRLWFGSAIVPQRISPDGRVRLGLGFDELIPLHRLYSRGLLGAAGRRV
ncbi:hypothetical protein [Asticcacaulis solisilvae]|uniref:hypothetical protein n=1 Tax=Asticcacaulis solisilvae TaxID=1217274 RepID=UPI003FD6C818